MKALKIIASVVMVLIVAVAVGAFFLFRNLDGIAEKAIENVGTNATGTEVEVGRVNLSLTEGRGEIAELLVGNPEGFSDEQALDINNIALQIEPASLRDDVIVLKEVLIDGARLRVEHRGLAQTNVKALLDHIRASVGGQDEASTEEQPGRERRFMIENLRFTGVSMDIASDQFENRTLEMQDIERSNLGSREQGLTPKELALAIAQPILEQSREKLEAELKQRAGNRLEQALDEHLSEDDKTKVDRLRSLID